jgi:preprotein translocase subunit SecD
MLNRFPLWKYLLILVVLIWAGIYALPNLYPDDPAVQVTPASASSALTSSETDRLRSAYMAEGIGLKSIELEENGSVLVRLMAQSDQLAARRVAQGTLGDEVVTALNLVPTTPAWLMALGAGPVKLGLDLRGGVHFLLEVDMDKAVEARLRVYKNSIRSELKKERIRYRPVSDEDKGHIQMLFRSESDRAAAVRVIRKSLRDLAIVEVDMNGRPGLRMQLTEAGREDIEEYAVSQNLVTLRNRVNELGVAEPLVQRQGRNRIVVELPGLQNTAEAKRILGKTANLEFRLEARSNAEPLETETMMFRDGSMRADLEKGVIVTGDQVSNAQANFDENGRPQVNINLDSLGGDSMFQETRNNVGRRMAVIFVEQKPVTRTVTEEVDGEQVSRKVQAFREEKGIISLATIQSPLGSSFRITGLDSPAESSELALLLRAGALAAPMYFVEERTIGPSLGQQNIDMGVRSVLIGFALVVMLMLALYKVFGAFAVIALGLNLVLLIAVMSTLGATLTLPGIAGIVLTVGMAVDANVLVFSRIREERNNTRSLQQAIHEGYDRAFTTILDANITTLLVAVILYAIGTGPVKGFAITLSVGILTSMFTAILVTRAMVNLTHGGRKLSKLWI